MTSEDWEIIRAHAAIAAMQGYCSMEMVFDDYSEPLIAGLAVKQADALIEELKKEK